MITRTFCYCNNDNARSAKGTNFIPRDIRHGSEMGSAITIKEVE